MTYNLSAGRKKALDLKRLTLKGMFVAGMLFVASPAVSQGNPDPGNNNEGCGGGAGGIEDPNSDNGVGQNLPPGCDPGIPAPLAAAGIPALLALGGGFIAVRKRRRDSQIKK